MPIEIRDLTHVYMPGTPFEKTALEDIKFTIYDGEFVGLIGHTGSGKSTLVQHLNGLMLPTRGTVVVNGINLADKDANMKTVRRRVGLVFQYPEYQLFEETVAKDIAFGPKNLGLKEDEIAARVQTAMRLVGLPDSVGEKSPFELSGGQKRRVAIAGVVAMQPDTLVLDEPAAGLDPAGRREMAALIASIHETGVTIIMVSHSMDDVAQQCRRIIVMNHGKVALDGTPAEIFTHGAELRAMGLGLPEAAQLRDQLREKGFDAIDPDAYTLDGVLDGIMKTLKKGN